MTNYDVIEAESTGGGAVRIWFDEAVEPSEWTVVAERKDGGDVKICAGAGTLTTEADGLVLAVPALFGGEAFRVWLSRTTTVKHDYDSTASDEIDDATIAAELRELRRKAEENATELRRALKVPESDSGTFSPSAPHRAGKILSFDENGNARAALSEADVRGMLRHLDAAIAAAQSASATQTAAEKAASATAGDASLCAQSVISAAQSAARAAAATDEHNQDVNAHSGLFQELREIIPVLMAEKISAIPSATSETKGLVRLSEEVSEDDDGVVKASQVAVALVAAKDAAAADALVRTANAQQSAQDFATAADAAWAATLRAEIASQNAPVIHNPTLAASRTTTLGTAESNASDVSGWYGYMKNLIPADAQPADGETAGIVPFELCVFRRNGTTTNGALSLYLRILRRNEAGDAWTVAYQSTNALKFNDVTAEGAEVGPWTLENKDGRGAIPPDENVIVCWTNTPAGDATNYNSVGAKTTNAMRGVFLTAVPTDGTAPGTQAYSLTTKLKWAKAEEAVSLSALLARLENNG